MKINILLMIVFILLTYGCSENSKGISGSVIDAETKKPIEGAVVFVEWTKSKGKWTGLGYTETYKISEKTTDKAGKFRVFGVLSPFVNPPTIVIYKNGYVAWRNDYIFPDYRRREDFRWSNGYEFKMEHFKITYLHSKHESFLSMSGQSLSSTKLGKAFSIEAPLAEKERDRFSKKLDELKQGKKTESHIWQEIIKELYFTEMREQ